MRMRRHFTLGCAILLAGFGVPMVLPSSSDAQVRARFNSGNFRGAYSSYGGFRGVYNGGNVKVGVNLGGYGRGYGGRGYYGGRGCWGGGGRWWGRNCYYPVYYGGGYYPVYPIYTGISIDTVGYGEPQNVSYLPPQYQPSTTNNETVNSQGNIIINSEKTIIYQGTPSGSYEEGDPSAYVPAGPQTTVVANGTVVSANGNQIPANHPQAAPQTTTAANTTAPRPDNYIYEKSPPEEIPAITYRHGGGLGF